MKNAETCMGLITFALVSGDASAGPLDGVAKQIDRNGAVVAVIKDGAGNDLAVIDNNGTVVLLGEDIIGVTAGQGGANANDRSVVGPFASGNPGCEDRTRIDLPGGSGSPCND